MTMNPAPVYRILLTCLLIWARCYGQPCSGQEPRCEHGPRQLLEEALGFMQQHYYRKSQVDWDSLASQARRRLENTDQDDAVGQTISWCFQQLHEPHSFLMGPDLAARYRCGATRAVGKPDLSGLMGMLEGEILDSGIAYLSVPWVHSSDSMICLQVADSIQRLIARLDAQGPSRWIIDLRGNSGGNCWPMLAGLGPLLGNGICGYFVNLGEKIPIAYCDGAAMQGKNIRCMVSRPYQTKSALHSMVVLTGNRTVSAGEIVALAFRGKEGVRLYGEPTAGYTTANATYSLSDNSMLVLSVCLEADRNGCICRGKVIPDALVTTQDPAVRDDLVRNSAIRWLSGGKP